MKIKKFNENADKSELDPYGEEKWSGEIEYDGNIIRFFKLLKNKSIDKKLDKLLGSDDLDYRMDKADEILSIIEDEYPDFYDQVEDDVRDLTLD